MKIFCVLLAVGIGTQAQAQLSYSTIDELIADLYAVISGPPGQRDWPKFENLFVPTATMGAMRNTPEGMQYNPMTPKSYVEHNNDFFLENSFTESEIGREIQQFGELAHVYSAYEFEVTMANGTTNSQRGINSIQLVQQDGRWWIVSIQWNAERDDNPLPKKLTRKK